MLVDGVINKNKFLANLCNELGSELLPDISSNKAVFTDVDDDKKEVIYSALSVIILDEFVKKSLMRLINKNCSYLTKNDKYEIWSLSMKNILNDQTEDDYMLGFVKDKLKEFFLSSDTVNVKGFVDFRLHDLEYDIEELVEQSIQDYLLELEYAEFINMLRFFVSIQKCKYNNVDVVFDEDVFIYGDGKDVTEECLGYFEDDFVNCETLDDFLLNSLITIAPENIFIIQKNKTINEELKKTLLGVFGKKITFITE